MSIKQKITLWWYWFWKPHQNICEGIWDYEAWYAKALRARRFVIVDGEVIGLPEEYRHIYPCRCGSLKTWYQILIEWQQKYTTGN